MISWKVSPLILHNIPASVGFLTFSTNQTSFFLYPFYHQMLTMIAHNHPHQWPFLLFHFFYFFHFFITILNPFNPMPFFTPMVAYTAETFLFIIISFFFGHWAYDHTCHTCSIFFSIFYDRLLGPFSLFFLHSYS